MFLAVELFNSPQSWGRFEPQSNDPDFTVQSRAFGSLLKFSSVTTITSEFEVFPSTVKQLSSDLFNYTYGRDEEVSHVKHYFATKLCTKTER